jgi:hypothetical protein
VDESGLMKAGGFFCWQILSRRATPYVTLFCLCVWCVVFVSVASIGLEFS